MTQKSTQGPTQRPSINDYYFALCKVASSRSPCLRRQTGAVLVKHSVVIATGYNGPPRGAPHCKKCLREGESSGERLDLCAALGLHAENNCLYACNRTGVSTVGAELYTINSPCKACCNAIAQAGISRVHFLEVYPGYTRGPRYLASLGVEVVHDQSTEMKVVPAPTDGLAFPRARNL